MNSNTIDEILNLKATAAATTYVVWSVPFNERTVEECDTYSEAMKLRDSRQRDEIANYDRSREEFFNDPYTFDWFAGTMAHFREFLADHA